MKRHLAGPASARDGRLEYTRALHKRNPGTGRGALLDLGASWASALWCESGEVRGRAVVAVGMR